MMTSRNKPVGQAASVTILSAKIPKNLLIAVAMMLVIIAASVASRLWMIDAPNFKPIAALALFGGFFLRRPLPVIFAVVAGMLISDLYLGFYEWPLACAVYLSLIMCCLLGGFVQRAPRGGINGMTFGRLGIASVSMSVLFFVFTNFACWALGWYPMTAAGLIDCYVAGIPFFRSTLISDLVFSQLLLGGYVVVLHVVGQRATVAAATE